MPYLLLADCHHLLHTCTDGFGMLKHITFFVDRNKNREKGEDGENMDLLEDGELGRDMDLLEDGELGRDMELLEDGELGRDMDLLEDGHLGEHSSVTLF